ncbi:E3 ubiquitin-protein ligase TRIM33-like isoform X2 [Mercenaria mercenaria]|uniref:E3 ubiquitin-protein ligase TRIM33-like isoform X2 n=1 Tax=Mercenaria mercenaria TaxID=6596 RepID=UPI00234E6E38|nr:E3 ubiquitin-protein ligase TRIM33-like isoform X2 [Mercenaria mercenaria]
MAVDGRKLGESVYRGSDDFHDFPCSPCSKEGRDVAAVKHCVDCDENMCTSCLKDHNKFSAMKGHQILDKVQRSVGRKLQLPNQRCTKHGGRLIDVYCPIHDSICCSTCIAVEHSSCPGIKFIPDVAKGISKSKEFQQFEADMKNLQSRFVSLIQSEDVELQALQQEQERICKEIRTLRNKINKHFDKMEEELLNEVNTKFKQHKQKVETDREETDGVLNEIKSRSHQLYESRHGNESELFALLKTGRKRMKES